MGKFIRGATAWAFAMVSVTLLTTMAVFVVWGLAWLGAVNLVTPTVLDDFATDTEMLGALNASYSPRTIQAWNGYGILNGLGCGPETDVPCFNWNDYGRVDVLLAWAPKQGDPVVRILRECDSVPCTYLQGFSAYVRPATAAEIEAARLPSTYVNWECRTKEYAYFFLSYTAEFCKAGEYLDGEAARVSYSAYIKTFETPIKLCDVHVDLITSHSRVCPEVAGRLGY